MSRVTGMNMWEKWCSSSGCVVGGFYCENVGFGWRGLVDCDVKTGGGDQVGLHCLRESRKKLQVWRRILLSLILCCVVL